jgi:hypothetical protein
MWVTIQRSFEIVRCISGDLIGCDVPVASIADISAEASRSKIDSNRGAIFMRLLLSAVTLIAASAVLGTPAQAQNYPWCALYNGGGVGGGTNCGFVSFAQCMETARGLGSFCQMNTQYVPPPGPHSQRRYPY